LERSRSARSGGILHARADARLSADHRPEGPALLAELKTQGYKIVHVRGKEPVKSLAAYDDMIVKEFAGSMIAKRPMSSVVRTISGE
jgi:hypothetical protein